jgi:hypothetical protein
MSRPCECDRQQGGPWVKGRDCRPCWLYHNDPRYKKLWDRASPKTIRAKAKQPALSEATIKELFGDETDETLLGNKIAALTAVLGIPTCGGCGKRKEWLNAAHKWLRGE